MNRLIRFVMRWPLVSFLINRFRYPGLTIDVGAHLNILGVFSYQNRCSIGEGANISVPTNTRFNLGHDNYLGRYVEIGVSGEIDLGDYSSVQDRCIFLGDIHIGRYCLFAPNVFISSGRHYYDLQPDRLIKDQDAIVLEDPALRRVHSRPVVIEDDCWLGINVVVMPGVLISKGAVVGANSVVTKDVPPYAVVSGAPAKLINQRLKFFPPQHIEYNNSYDIPYFYAGFEVDSTSQLKYAEYKGLVCQQDFTLCLEPSGKESICLLARILTGKEGMLFFANQKLPISDIFEKICFFIDNDTETKLRFRAELNCSNGLLLIQKAWVQ